MVTNYKAKRDSGDIRRCQGSHFIGLEKRSLVDVEVQPGHGLEVSKSSSWSSSQSRVEVRPAEAPRRLLWCREMSCGPGAR